MTKVLIWVEPQNRSHWTNVMRAGNKQFAFPFSVVDREMIGQPEEESATKQHRVVVTLSDVMINLWSLSEADTEKILFECGSRYIAEKVKTNFLPDSFEIEMPMITQHTHPKKCPFNPARIKAPSAVRSIEIPVEAERARMGFMT
jgi:hypothetical protein